MTLEQFPGLKTLNEARHNWFNEIRDQTNSSSAKVIYWSGHKILVLCSLSLNIVAMALGLGLTVTSSLVLGSIKVFIYAFTLGNNKPTFPSGFFYFGERTLMAAAESAFALGEVATDTIELTCKCYKTVKRLFNLVHLTQLFNTTIKQVRRGLNLMVNHISQGYNVSIKDEKSVVYNGLPGLSKLEKFTKAYRINFEEKKRPLKEIGIHYLLSAVNIPLQTLACACALVASIVLSTAFMTKVAIYAATGIKLPAPTAVTYALEALSDTSIILAKDIGTDFVDIFIIVHKTSNYLNLTTVFTKALDVVLFVPRAVFS